MTLDFGFTPLVSLGSLVFVDNDDNGIFDQDDLDERLEGVTVQLFNLGEDGIAENGDDELVAEDVTDANGRYFFEDLVPGDYYVAIPTVDPNFPVSSCLLYTSPSPRDLSTSRMPSSA